MSELHEPEWLRLLSGVATKHDLKEMEQRIMSAITTWATAEQADLDGIKTTLNGIVNGIAALNAQITAFNNSPGTLSAADQAALDGIKASSDALVTQAQQISTNANTPGNVAGAPTAKE